MGQTTPRKQKTTLVKGRVLTPAELDLSEQLQKMLTQKVSAEALLRQANKEISRLTQEINKLGFARATVVWAEAREKLGAPPAPTREDLLRK